MRAEKRKVLILLFLLRLLFFIAYVVWYNCCGSIKVGFVLVEDEPRFRDDFVSKLFDLSHPEVFLKLEVDGVLLVEIEHLLGPQLVNVNVGQLPYDQVVELD